MKIYKVAGGRDPDQPADGPRRPERPDLQDQGRQVEGGRRRDRGAPRDGPAGPRRHDLGRGLGDALRASSKRAGIEHAVLNAKPEHAEREGETIAQAGRLGAVTIATNMAGRGVDIKLGGNPEHLAQRRAAPSSASSPATRATTRRCDERPPTLEEQRRGRGATKVVEARRPLHLRHRAPRVAPDRQPAARPLRPPGRPRRVALLPLRRGRPVRLFAGDRIYKILDRLGPIDEEGEEEPLEAKMLTKQIENAQKKVEEQNFLIRKRVLEYDDVMNEQRERRLQVPATRSSRAATCPTSPASEIGEVDRAASSTSTRRATLRGLGPRRAVDASSSRSGRSSVDLDELDAETVDREELASSLRRGRARRLRRARGGVRRRAHARRSSATSCCRSSTSAGASTSTRWTTCARASTCAASPRSTRSSPTRTRASRCSRS